MIGTTINDRYEITSEIGRGGMGTVFRAHDGTLNRDVALKLMSNTDLGTEGRARLLNEAQTVAQLDHPNIVTVFDAGEYDSKPFIVMQVVDGGTLYDKRPENLDQTLGIIKQVCAALEYAHQHDVIHRDLKPENVAVSENGTAKLMDFGLARSVASRMTSEGNIVGTVFYMPPEQAMGQELDPRADLYALGVMLYELTTGELPFVDENPIAVITQHINAPVVPPRAKNEEIPAYLENLILRLMEKDRDDRLESAAAVLEILEAPEDADISLRESKELAVLDRIVRGRIVGRQEEYEEARALWNEVADGTGHTLLISGEPGIGKTRLMREVVTQSEVSGGRALVGEASAENNAPYGAFAQMVRRALDQNSKNGVELPDFVLDDVLNLAPDLRPYYPDIKPNPRLDPESEQTRLLENMVAFCSAFSESSPLLLVLDDAHWADGSSIALFQHLARRTTRQPIMMLATYREVELREARPFNEMLLELNRRRIGTRIKLNRLNKDETRDMLAAIFNDEITQDFLEGIYRETDGNPFFIEEVCRALVESGRLYFEDGEWHRPSMEELEIPQGIQVAVESRLSKLPENVQEVLRMAAVLGREFDYEVLIEASEQGEDDVIDAIELADRAQMVKEGREDTLYEFVHALVPQSIRENTHRLRLRKLHKRAAAAFEAVQPDNYESLAYHNGEGGNDAEALRYYRLAGERALENYANQDGENHFIAALNLTESDAERAELLPQLAMAQNRLGQHHDAVEARREAIAILLAQGDRDGAAHQYALAGRATWESGDVQGDLDLCREGLEAVEGAPDGPGLAHLYSETARACYFNGVHEEVQEYADRALELADQFELIAVRADTLITLGTFKGAQSPEAIPILEEAIALAEKHDLVREVMRGSNNLGVLHGNQGDYEPSIKSYEKSVEIARRTGHISQQVFYFNNVIWSLMFVGRTAEAEKGYRDLEPLLDQLADPELGARITNNSRGFYLYQTGRFDEAEELINQNIEEELATNDLYSLSGSYNGKSFVLMAIGKFREAEEVLMNGVEVGEKIGQAEFPYLFAAIAASRDGSVERAEQHLNRALEIIGDDPPIYWKQVNLMRAQAHLDAARGEWEAAWSKFKELDALIVEKQTLGIDPWMKFEWAENHILRGKPEDIKRARELLGIARDASEKIGADGWVKLIDEKLEKIDAG